MHGLRQPGPFQTEDSGSRNPTFATCIRHRALNFLMRMQGPHEAHGVLGRSPDKGTPMQPLMAQAPLKGPKIPGVDMEVLDLSETSHLYTCALAFRVLCGATSGGDLSGRT